MLERSTDWHGTNVPNHSPRRRAGSSSQNPSYQALVAILACSPGCVSSSNRLLEMQVVRLADWGVAG